MNLIKDIETIIDTCDITQFKKSIASIDYDNVLKNTDPVTTARATQFIDFYENSLRSGLSKDTTAKVLLRLNELFVRESIKDSVLKYLASFSQQAAEAEKKIEQAGTFVSPENKKVEEFKHSLLYAAERWGTKAEISSVQKLVQKIKDGKR